MVKAGSQLATASFYMYESCQRKRAYTDAEKALNASERQGPGQGNEQRH